QLLRLDGAGCGPCLEIGLVSLRILGDAGVHEGLHLGNGVWRRQQQEESEESKAEASGHGTSFGRADPPMPAPLPADILHSLKLPRPNRGSRTSAIPTSAGLRLVAARCRQAAPGSWGGRGPSLMKPGASCPS